MEDNLDLFLELVDSNADVADMFVYNNKDYYIFQKYYIGLVSTKYVTTDKDIKKIDECLVNNAMFKIKVGDIWFYISYKSITKCSVGMAYVETYTSLYELDSDFVKMLFKTLHNVTNYNMKTNI